jgi:putative transposase
MARSPKQLALPIPCGWGGRRKGAGRKPKGERAGVAHTARPLLARRFPVHVTLRVLPHVWNLRSRRVFRVLRRALAEGGERFGIRICEFSIQGNHVHLMAEAHDARSLSLGMQGLGVRMARGLNRIMNRRGKVLADRFHARILRSPTEVRRALLYVRDNRAVHRARWSGGNHATGLAQGGARHARRAGHTRSGEEIRADIPSPKDAELVYRGAELVYRDRYSSAGSDHGFALPEARTYLLLRAQAEAS